MGKVKDCPAAALKSFWSLPATYRAVVAPETVPPGLAASVRMFAPVVSRPLVSVSVPLTVGLLFRVTPLALLIVRLFKAVTLLGILTPTALPPKTRLEAAVVARLAGVPAIAGPLSVRVLAPTANGPLASVNVPLIVAAPDRLTPASLLMARFATVAGRPLPVIWAAGPL